MSRLLRFLLVLPLTIGFAAAIAEEPVHFNENSFLYIDGRPRLVIGLYERPDEDAVLDQVAASGFNIVRGTTDVEVLDRLHAHGLSAWIPLGGALKLAEGDDAARQKLIDTVNTFKDHPGLLCWEAPDEALWIDMFKSYDWLFEQQPAQLMQLIQKAAAEKGPEEAGKYGQMLAKAVDFSQRNMWKESEELYDKIWTELGDGDPNPHLSATARLESAHQLGDRLTRGWECVWEQDKRHVLWQNHAPCNSITDLRHHNRAVHAAGCDIYPAPPSTGVVHGQALRDMDLTGVGEATEHMRRGAPGKACWMVLQGFGWTDLKERFNPHDPERGRRPTFQESRFMAYDALLHGADAILYWGTHAIEKDSVLWGDLMKVAKELRALEPAIVGTKPPREPVVVAETNYTTFNGGDPKLMLRQVDDDWVLIAVNEWRFVVAFDVHGLPEALNGRTLYRLYSDETHPVEDGGFHDGILGHDVHVYATTRDFEAKP